VDNFSIALDASQAILHNSIEQESDKRVNAELCKQALAKVGNPNVLVNLVSRRVRQLNSGAGAMSRPLIANADNLGAADIALLELIEEKIGWEIPEPLPLVETAPKRRRKS
jgi:DNA-directed RNA polymerase subunit omega